MSERGPEQPVDYYARDELLTSRIAHWQKELDFVPFESVSLDTREAVEASLNECWAYADEDCIFSGIGRMSRALYDLSAKEDFIDGGIGKSAGLLVVAFGKPDSRRWLISYTFREALTEPGTIIAGEYVFLEASRANTIPLSELEEALNTTQQPQESLNQLSDKLARDLGDVNFLRLPIAEQKYHISCALVAARGSAEAFGGIEAKQVIVEAERGFVLEIAQKGPAHYRALDLASSPIVGTCRGLDVLARSEAITATDQFVDSKAGLFLVLEPDEGTASGCGVKPGQYVYLPISSQELGVTFLETPNLE